MAGKRYEWGDTAHPSHDQVQELERLRFLADDLIQKSVLSMGTEFAPQFTDAMYTGEFEVRDCQNQKRSIPIFEYDEDTIIRGYN